MFKIAGTLSLHSSFCAREPPVREGDLAFNILLFNQFNIFIFNNIPPIVPQKIYPIILLTDKFNISTEPLKVRSKYT